MRNGSRPPDPPLADPSFIPLHLRLPPRVLLSILAALVIVAIPLGVIAGTLHAKGSPAATATPKAGAGQATITFTRATRQVSAPRSTLVAATSGGQIRATRITVTVKQVTSAPIQAQFDGTQYVVPANCGDASPAYHAASQGLQAKLSSMTSGDLIAFSGPYFGYGNLSCQPAPGTAQATAFVYTEQIDGSATQVGYRLSDAQLYQIAQMQGTLPAHMVLESTSTCSGVPSMSNRAGDSVTIVCPTTGLAAWDWETADLQHLAAQLVGLTPAAATALLNRTPGVAPGSVTIAAHGAATLPQQGAQIVFVVNG